jgi:homospermidine synthase
LTHVGAAGNASHAIENPWRVLPDAEVSDHGRILAIQKPCHGRMVGACTDRTQLDNRNGDRFLEVVDRDDPWQFHNLFVSEASRSTARYPFRPASTA